MGLKILVKPIEHTKHKTTGGLEVIETLDIGEVVEFSQEFKEVYKKGDKVLFSKDAGDSIVYDGEAHVFLNGNGAPVGHVWAKVSE